MCKVRMVQKNLHHLRAPAGDLAFEKIVTIHSNKKYNKNEKITLQIRGSSL